MYYSVQSLKNINSGSSTYSLIDILCHPVQPLFCSVHVPNNPPPPFLLSFPQVFTRSVGARCQTPVTQWLVRQPLEGQLKWGELAGPTHWITVPPSGGRLSNRICRAQKGLFQFKKQSGGQLPLVGLKMLHTNFICD